MEECFFHTKDKLETICDKYTSYGESQVDFNDEMYTDTTSDQPCSWSEIKELLKEAEEEQDINPISYPDYENRYEDECDPDSDGQKERQGEDCEFSDNGDNKFNNKRKKEKTKMNNPFKAGGDIIEKKENDTDCAPCDPCVPCSPCGPCEDRGNSAPREKNKTTSQADSSKCAQNAENKGKCRYAENFWYNRGEGNTNCNNSKDEQGEGSNSVAEINSVSCLQQTESELEEETSEVESDASEDVYFGTKYNRCSSPCSSVSSLYAKDVPAEPMTYQIEEKDHVFKPSNDDYICFTSSIEEERSTRKTNKNQNLFGTELYESLECEKGDLNYILNGADFGHQGIVTHRMESPIVSLASFAHDKIEYCRKMLSTLTGGHGEQTILDTVSNVDEKLRGETIYQSKMPMRRTSLNCKEDTIEPRSTQNSPISREFLFQDGKIQKQAEKIPETSESETDDNNENDRKDDDEDETEESETESDDESDENYQTESDNCNANDLWNYAGPDAEYHKELCRGITNCFMNEQTALAVTTNNVFESSADEDIEEETEDETDEGGDTTEDGDAIKNGGDANDSDNFAFGEANIESSANEESDITDDNYATETDGNNIDETSSANTDSSDDDNPSVIERTVNCGEGEKKEDNEQIQNAQENWAGFDQRDELLQSVSDCIAVNNNLVLANTSGAVAVCSSSFEHNDEDDDESGNDGLTEDDEEEEDVRQSQKAVEELFKEFLNTVKNQQKETLSRSQSQESLGTNNITKQPEVVSEQKPIYESTEKSAVAEEPTVTQSNESVTSTDSIRSTGSKRERFFKWIGNKEIFKFPKPTPPCSETDLTKTKNNATQEEDEINKASDDFATESKELVQISTDRNANEDEVSVTEPSVGEPSEQKRRPITPVDSVVQPKDPYQQNKEKQKENTPRLADEMVENIKKIPFPEFQDKITRSDISTKVVKKEKDAPVDEISDSQFRWNPSPGSRSYSVMSNEDNSAKKNKSKTNHRHISPGRNNVTSFRINESGVPQIVKSPKRRKRRSSQSTSSSSRSRSRSNSVNRTRIRSSPSPKSQSVQRVPEMADSSSVDARKVMSNMSPPAGVKTSERGRPMSRPDSSNDIRLINDSEKQDVETVNEKAVVLKPTVPPTLTKDWSSLAKAEWSKRKPKGNDDSTPRSPSTERKAKDSKNPQLSRKHGGNSSKSKLTLNNTNEQPSTPRTPRKLSPAPKAANSHSNRHIKNIGSKRKDNNSNTRLTKSVVNTFEPDAELEDDKDTNADDSLSLPCNVPRALISDMSSFAKEKTIVSGKHLNHYEKTKTTKSTIAMKNEKSKFTERKNKQDTQSETGVQERQQNKPKNYSRSAAMDKNIPHWERKKDPRNSDSHEGRKPEINDGGGEEEEKSLSRNSHKSFRTKADLLKQKNQEQRASQNETKALPQTKKTTKPANTIGTAVKQKSSSNAQNSQRDSDEEQTKEVNRLKYEQKLRWQPRNSTRGEKTKTTRSETKLEDVGTKSSRKGRNQTQRLAVENGKDFAKKYGGDDNIQSRADRPFYHLFMSLDDDKSKAQNDEEPDKSQTSENRKNQTRWKVGKGGRLQKVHLDTVDTSEGNKKELAEREQLSSSLKVVPTNSSQKRRTAGQNRRSTIDSNSNEHKEEEAEQMKHKAAMKKTKPVTRIVSLTAAESSSTADESQTNEVSEPEVLVEELPETTTSLPRTSKEDSYPVAPKKFPMTVFRIRSNDEKDKAEVLLARTKGNPEEKVVQQRFNHISPRIKTAVDLPTPPPPPPQKSSWMSYINPLNLFRGSTPKVEPEPEVKPQSSSKPNTAPKQFKYPKKSNRPALKSKQIEVVPVKYRKEIEDFEEETFDSIAAPEKNIGNQNNEPAVKTTPKAVEKLSHQKKSIYAYKDPVVEAKKRDEEIDKPVEPTLPAPSPPKEGWKIRADEMRAGRIRAWAEKTRNKENSELPSEEVEIEEKVPPRPQKMGNKSHNSSKQMFIVATNKQFRSPDRSNTSQVNRRMNVNLNATSNRRQKKNIARAYKPDPIDGTELDAVMENANNNNAIESETNNSNVGFEEEEA